MLNEQNNTDANTEHIEELAAAYALGSLHDDEAGLKEFESLIESGDPILAPSLEKMLGASAALAAAVPQIEPPATLRASLMESVAKLKQAPPSKSPLLEEPIRSNDAARLKTRTRYFIGTSILSGLLLCVLLAIDVSKTAQLDRSNDLMKALLRQTDSLRGENLSEAPQKTNDTAAVAAIPLKDNSDLNSFFSMFGDQDAKLVTMVSAPLGTAREHLLFSPKLHRITLLREKLRPLDGNSKYVLWATVGGRSPVAVGSFRIDAKDASQIFNFPTKLKNADAFAITIEHGDGATVQKGKILFTGEVPKAGIN